MIDLTRVNLKLLYLLDPEMTFDRYRELENVRAAESLDDVPHQSDCRDGDSVRRDLDIGGVRLTASQNESAHRAFSALQTIVSEDAE